MALSVGMDAPNFTAKDSEGNTVSLSGFAGKTVVLYFYPKDDTPGCTKQAQSFRDNYA
ncbi:MAG: redoxin domain-containing protein, partial [Coleofasciculus sp. Co-bin14]|nr:redoxin domain-containing protein [Coleofasciculus sp. Co-bin14]